MEHLSIHTDRRTCQYTYEYTSVVHIIRHNYYTRTDHILSITITILLVRYCTGHVLCILVLNYAQALYKPEWKYSDQFGARKKVLTIVWKQVNFNILV